MGRDERECFSGDDDARATRSCGAVAKGSDVPKCAISDLALTQARSALEQALAIILQANRVGEPWPIDLKRTAPSHREQAVACLRTMRKRAKITKPPLGEGAWAILLDLFVNRDRRISITSACLGSGHPATTALRWLKLLEASDLIARDSDGFDGRKAYVRLTERGQAAVRDYLAA